MNATSKTPTMYMQLATPISSQAAKAANVHLMCIDRKLGLRERPEQTHNSSILYLKDKKSRDLLELARNMLFHTQLAAVLMHPHAQTKINGTPTSKMTMVNRMPINFHVRN